MGGNRLLIDDYPIQVLPKLAEEIGLNEAIILQQIHYWLNGKNAHVRDGKRWVYNTYEGWREQFPFWSVATIRRVIGSLERKKLLLISNYNKAGFDKTKWYSIDYAELKRVSRRFAQNEQTYCSNCTDGTAQNEQTNTIDYTETTTETTKYIDGLAPISAPVEEYKLIISHLNEKAGTNFKHSSKATQTKIQARLNEGYTVDDFKEVIDTKVRDWKTDKQFAKFLRPQTLFGTKFEGYLNETALSKQSQGGYTRDYDMSDLPF